MRWTWLAAAVLAAATPQASSQAGAEPLTWDRHQHLTGVFDVGGPLPDGRLVVAGSRQLYLLDRATGQVATLGPEGGQGGEAYMAVSPSPALAVAASGCAFSPGEVYQLTLGSSPGVTRIDAEGQAHPFAAVKRVDALNGIAFDTGGRFGHRLLVSGSHRGGTTVVALDCRGQGRLVTDAGPTLEGGLAVAPRGFGSFAGDLIAPDELSGDLIAIRPDGSSAVIAKSGLPTGGDIGVESLGFVPAGFESGGHAYLADRATPNNPHPGTDSLLRLDAGQLTRAGVRDGDLLAGTEGGALTIGIRCGQRCRVFRVAQGPTVAHGEGHLLLVADQPARASGSLPAARDLGATVRAAGLVRQLAELAVIVLVAALGTGLLAWWLRRRRERRHV
jgi:hypothetical protein